MKIHELLFEGREADLYHGTDYVSAAQIMRHNVMKAGIQKVHSSLPQSFKGHEKTVSFSRVMSVAKWFVDDNDDVGVIFVVDQGKLYRDVGKRMRPHEYQVGEPGEYIPPEQQSNRGNQQSEHEETVYGDIPNFSSYVKQIIVFIPEGMTTREALPELKSYELFYDPRTIVVRTHKPNLTGRQFVQLLKTKPKTKIDTSKVKRPKEVV